MTSRIVSDYVMERIRFIRRERGWTVAQTAQRAGIPLGSYSCLETKRYRLNLENLLRIQLVLGVEIWALWPNPRGKVNHATDEVLQAVVRAAESWLPKPVTIQAVLKAVCEVYGFSVDQLAHPSRRRDLSEARAVATLVCGDLPHVTLIALSHELRRDVSSLSHCLRRMKVRLRYERQLRDRVRAVRRLLS